MIVPNWQDVFPFLILLVVLLWRPWGLFGRPRAKGRRGVESVRVMPRPVAAVCAVVVLALLAVPLLDSRYLHRPLHRDHDLRPLRALSLNVLIGYSGNVSFGHAAYFAIGGYTCAILLTTYEWGFAPAFAAAVIAASALAAGLVAWFCVRLTDIYFAMLTLAFAMVVWGWRSSGGA